MKKISIWIINVMLMASILGGCGNNAEIKEGKNAVYSIVCTTFPTYDWVIQILGDKNEEVEVTMLMDNGVDLHSYQPSTDDIIKISTCDMFVHVGGESDAWVKDVLKNSVNENMIIVNLLDVLGSAVVEENIVEGMEHKHEDHEAHEHKMADDEHVWLSLRHAQVLCNHIAQQMGIIDHANAEIYMSNAEAYNSELAQLDSKYLAMTEKAAYHTLVFADRFPFRYLADDYALDCYAAFTGCSAESEASFETIVFLAEKVDELGLKNVMVIEGSDGNIAKTVIDATTGKNQGIVSMNSMQSITSAHIQEGTTYLSIMNDNLAALETALN